MKVAFASSEVVPFAKTGGLADVSGALPIELKKLGLDIKVFMPKYYFVDEYKYNLHYDDFIGELKIRSGGYPHSIHVFRGYFPDSEVEVFFVHSPHFFHRHHIYTNDWDEDERFVVFSKAVIEIIQHLGWSPDVIHCNDWQTSLIPLFIKDNYSWDRMFDQTATVLTIHNIAYQGRYGKETLSKAEIRGTLFYPGGPVEHEDDVNFLKAGISFSDVINTVSETYVQELFTAEYGSGMQHVLLQRRDDFYGILNGVDYILWNPESDRHLPFHYSMNDLSGKYKNKEVLLRHFKLPIYENVPLIGIISRFVAQKGLDIIAEALNELVHLEAQWIILGSGDTHYEDLFRSMAYYFPHKVAVYFGYNNALSHLIEAGADIFLMPSKYEPCGLNQIYSLKYGTVPVVRKTGGLADTIQDWNEYNTYGLDIGNGYSFHHYSGDALLHSIQRAIRDFHNKPVWHKIQMNGMSRDYSWKKSTEKYVELYQKAIMKKRG